MYTNCLSFGITMKHWLLYTSDREHGGTLIEGIFNSEGEAWDHYLKTHDEDKRYWRRPHVECWEDDKKIVEGET